MATCRFIYDNKWLVGTLTASSEDANFPASNTRHRWHTRSWRTAATYIASQWVKLNRGGSTPAITAAAIKFNNFNGASISIQGHASDLGSGDWGAATYNQTWTVNNDVMVHFPSSSQSLQWWRLYITNTSPLTYVEAGTIFLGTYFEPARNFNYGVQLRSEDPSLISFSEGGQLSSIMREKYFNKDYVFSHFSTDEKEAFCAVFDEVGFTKGFVFVEDPDDSYDTSHYVRFTKFDWKWTALNNWELQMSIEELR